MNANNEHIQWVRAVSVIIKTHERLKETLIFSVLSHEHIIYEILFYTTIQVFIWVFLITKPNIITLDKPIIRFESMKLKKVKRVHYMRKFSNILFTERLIFSIIKFKSYLCFTVSCLTFSQFFLLKQFYVFKKTLIIRKE